MNHKVNPILTFKAPVDKNGNTEQIIVDPDKKEYSRGYYLFIGGGTKVASKNDLDELEYELKQYDFKEVK